MFPGHGRFEGRVLSFDGCRYHVYYEADDDEEDLNEVDLDLLDIIEHTEEAPLPDIPLSGAQASC